MFVSAQLCFVYFSSLRVTATDELKGKVQGLCGEYDDYDVNDLVTKRGVPTNDVAEFIKSWRVDGYGAPGSVYKKNMLKKKKN